MTYQTHLILFGVTCDSEELRVRVESHGRYRSSEVANGFE